MDITINSEELCKLKRNLRRVNIDPYGEVDSKPACLGSSYEAIQDFRLRRVVLGDRNERSAILQILPTHLHTQEDIPYLWCIYACDPYMKSLVF